MHSETVREILWDYHGINMGMYSYGCLKPESIPSGTTIGRYCSFAHGVTIFNANHPLERISQHPFFYNPKLGMVKRETISRRSITIGNDVWIGKNVLILPNVSQIGNGAVIGAGAVVTRDVPPYAVIVGNPGRLLRYRFPEEVRKKIDESRWWDKPIDMLCEQLGEFLKPVTPDSELLMLAPYSKGNRPDNAS